ncbi:MAG TPA: hypothetical protein VEW03_09120 [Longimicrobiaceae bacterium]|nr:hypothetical protein [Longimicrobiaceae bacterium]
MKTEKTFDSVRMMRELRDRMSRDMQGMTFEEQKDYIRRKLSWCPEAVVPLPSRDNDTRSHSEDC